MAAESESCLSDMWEEGLGREMTEVALGTKVASSDMEVTVKIGGVVVILDGDDDDDDDDLESDNELLSETTTNNDSENLATIMTK